MKILATALIAAASLAVAAAPSAASAAPTLACAAATESLTAEITRSAHLASDSGEGTATTERLRGGLLEETSGSTADQQGRRDRQAPVVVARSCI